MQQFDGTLAAGPDGAIAADATSCGPLQWVTQHPVWDRPLIGDGESTLDPRILVAVLEPGRATWLVAARSTPQATFELLEAMRTDVLQAGPASEHVLTVAFDNDLPAVSDVGCRVIEGGRWNWDGTARRGDQDLLLMSLVNASGHPVARVSMDAATAANLYRSIDRTVRVKTPLIARGLDEEESR
ncbi:MAG: hypothetical protein QF561_07435 [Phycisphaerales bacterium]|jgi:hypothetical protein|nr:hypothetical protein [Phycisphaerales bacterium]